MFGKNRDLIWFLVVLALFVGILPILIWGSRRGYMYGMMGMMGYGWAFMFLIPAVFLLLIVLGGYYLITEAGRTDKSESSHGERALEILKERYTKGEITREQYLKMKEDLGS